MIKCQYCGKEFTSKNLKRMFCNKSCSNKSRNVKGENNGSWKGGRSSRRGYILRRAFNHPRQQDGYVMEHILVIEKHLGRYLTKEEVVHHINHKRDDNKIENLMLLSRKEHLAIHRGKDGRCEKSTK